VLPLGITALEVLINVFEYATAACKAETLLLSVAKESVETVAKLPRA
jgi:hypothetical protein